MHFGTRSLKCWVLGPCGFYTSSVQRRPPLRAKGRANSQAEVSWLPGAVGWKPWVLMKSMPGVCYSLFHNFSNDVCVGIIAYRLALLTCVGVYVTRARM